MYTNNGFIWIKKGNSRKAEKFIQFEKGQKYYFRKGDTFQIRINEANFIYQKQNTANKLTIFDSYGKGEKPIISSFIKIAKAECKYVENKKIYSIDLSPYINSKKFSIKEVSNIGFIKFDSELVGLKKKSENDLIEVNSFCSTDSILFFNISKELLDITQYIYIAPNVITINLFNDIVLSNCKIEGTGGHAIKGTHVNNVYLKNLTIENIGGSILEGFKDNTVRYGNGIEFWNSASNCYITNCIIKNVYDAALSFQGNENNMVFNKLIFENNLLINNGQAFEFWTKGNNNKINYILFKNNICKGSGFSWSREFRLDKNVGYHILNYSLETVSNCIHIINNQFYDSQDGVIGIFQYKPNTIIFNASNNKLFVNHINLLKINSQTIKLTNTNKQLEIIKKGFNYITKNN